MIPRIHFLDPTDGDLTSLHGCDDLVIETPSWSPDSTRFALTCDGSLVSLVSPWTGSQTSFQACRNSTLTTPSWSPDGRLLAFICRFDHYDDEIYIVNTDDGDRTRITFEKGDEKQPTWSPDGSKIAFASDLDGDFEIYVVEVER